MLELPPLRDRSAEVLPLARRFLEQAAARAGKPALELLPEAEGLLRAYDWPGNVRELRNVMERAVAVSPSNVIGPDELPPHLRRVPPGEPEAGPAPALSSVAPEQELVRDMDYRERVAAFERGLIQQALAQTGGSQREAAELLGLPRRTLTHKIRVLGVKYSSTK